MGEKVHRLRPRTHDKAAEALQVVLELPLPLRPETRADLTGVMSSYAPEPWPFVMLSTPRGREIVRQIGKEERSGITAKVWLACLSHAVYRTNEIAATRKELAELVGTTEQEVSRALSKLCRTTPPALIRVAPGKYELHPTSAWSGPDTERRAKLELVTS